MQSLGRRWKEVYYYYYYYFLFIYNLLYKILVLSKYNKLY
jgi:hypothetical protein